MPDVQNEKPKPMVGVSVIVKNGDRFLLVKRNKAPMTGAWKAPGGHMDFGETPEETAIREVREETGVVISDVKFRVMTNDVFEADNRHYLTVWMEARYVSGEPEVDAPEEEAEVRWFTWDSLPDKLYLDLQHLLAGETYPSQTTESKVGAAIESQAFQNEVQGVQSQHI